MRKILASRPTATAIVLLAVSVLASCATPHIGPTRPLGEKSSAAFQKEEVFIVSNADWRAVVSLVPVTTWTETSRLGELRVEKFPTLIYHREDPTTFDADSVVHFLQQYQPQRVTIVGRPPHSLYNLVASHPSRLVGAGLKASQIRIITPEKYISFWKHYRAVVYVPDRYSTALLASTYASFLNVPLVIQGGPLDTEAVLAGKRRICVGFRKPFIGCDEYYDRRSLQRRYVSVTRTNRVVVANPLDLAQGLTGSYQPEKSGWPIGTTFSHMSLAAPILASAKHQLLITTPAEANDCGPYEGSSSAAFTTVDDEISTVLGAVFQPPVVSKPRYLTIVASPKSIAYWNQCGSSYSGAADWQYGSQSNDVPGLHVGRIYSLTVSGASAYVARSVFYDVLVNKGYDDQEYTGLAIAAPNFGQDQINAQQIQQQTTAAGYASICFTWYGSSAQPSCDVYTNLQTADYLDRQFVSFADHGGPSVWGGGTLSASTVPWLELPYAVSLACQTNNFWGGGSSTLGPTWLRRGGISYHAAIPSTDGYNWELWSIQELTTPTRQSLGEIASALLARTDYNSEVKRHYALLGDPTLVPRSRSVQW